MACFKGYEDGMLHPRFDDDSSQFLYWVRNDLNDHYYRTGVSSQRVAVTLDFTDIVTDVTPCFWKTSEDEGFWMPDGHGGWMLTNPPFHAKLVADADQAKANKLKPVIRLMKARNNAHGHHLSSFHLEMLVEEAQRPYQIYDPAFEVWWTMRSIAWRLKYRFPDPWAPGGSGDDYLPDDARALVIRKLSAEIERSDQARTFEAAGWHEATFERWGVVYHGTFPAYY